MRRVHFGEGELTLAPSKSIFINCPFDAEYAPLFDAIVFTTVCCGFIPRCALESGTVSEPRLARILRALLGSKYSIHDLSRCTGEGSENTARFNMPLELGMAMARQFIDADSRHDWLVLVPRGHAYLRFASDLAAYDPKTHDGSVHGVIIAIMSWLATRKDTVPPVTPKEVLSLLPLFEKAKQDLDAAWHGEPPWADVVKAAIDIAKRLDVPRAGRA
ncbi:MAG: hypothetical protein U0Q16_39020 [Bryobacteraceae bacterium]